MNQKKRRFKPYGLQKHFVLTLLHSAVVCAVSFLLLSFLFGVIENAVQEKIDHNRQLARIQTQNLQKYIDRNSISSENLEPLDKWEKRHPVIFLELYSENDCIYSSFREIPLEPLEDGEEFAETEKSVTLRLADAEVTAVLYSDFSYQLYVIGLSLAAVLSIIAAVYFFLRRNRQLILYICRLNDEVQILEGGNLDYQVLEEGNNEITELARSMNRMRKSLLLQMETEQRLHQAGRQLVTQLSHDLRTPLTGIMLYLEVLRSHRYSSEEELQNYLEKMDAKAHQMKQMSDHLFEYSLDGELPRQPEPAGMEQAFGHAANAFREELVSCGFSTEFEQAWLPAFVHVRPDYIQRIFDNILSNIVKYAAPASEIRFFVIDADAYCGFSVMNLCSAGENTVESTGVGLASIRSMMQQMNGLCTVEQTDEVYEITLLFPKQ